VSKKGEDETSLKETVNVSQPRVDRHLVDIPQSSTQARYRIENVRTSENPDALVFFGK
jgi:hypothetical protein